MEPPYPRNDRCPLRPARNAVTPDTIRLSSIFVAEKPSAVNGVRARIQAQSTILTGKNVPPATALEPNVMRSALDAGERDGFLSEDDVGATVNATSRRLDNAP
jgi:hypothetical protein